MSDLFDVTNSKSVLKTQYNFLNKEKVNISQSRQNAMGIFANDLIKNGENSYGFGDRESYARMMHDDRENTMQIKRLNLASGELQDPNSEMSKHRSQKKRSDKNKKARDLEIKSMKATDEETKLDLMRQAMRYQAEAVASGGTEETIMKNSAEMQYRTAKHTLLKNKYESKSSEYDTMRDRITSLKAIARPTNAQKTELKNLTKEFKKLDSTMKEWAAKMKTLREEYESYKKDSNRLIEKKTGKDILNYAEKIDDDILDDIQYNEHNQDVKGDAYGQKVDDVLAKANNLSVDYYKPTKERFGYAYRIDEYVNLSEDYLKVKNSEGYNNLTELEKAELDAVEEKLATIKNNLCETIKASQTDQGDDAISDAEKSQIDQLIPNTLEEWKQSPIYVRFQASKDIL